MKIDIRRLAQLSELAAVVLLAALGAYLVTSPLHPRVGDSHRGMMAVFPGILLLLTALIIYTVGKFLSRRGSWGLSVRILVSVFFVVAVAMLAFR
jgi:heme A synthase